MATFLIVQGMEEVELDESFNNTRHRINEAVTGVRRNGNADLDGHRPLHYATFRTIDEDGNIGRIAVVPEKIIGVGSDTEKDGEEE